MPKSRTRQPRTARKTIPFVIQEIINQLGGHPHINSAFCYTGTSQITYQDKYGGKANSTVHDNGLIDFPCGIVMHVNGKPKENWAIFVTLEASDTYTVRLCRKANPQERPQQIIILYEETHVYCDALKTVVERMYDKAISEHNGGFINI